ncbi:MAG: HRDC domain-containing protein, partial [Janthinobacterium lividum]
TLAEIASRAPDSISALKEIPGIGARKLERFGHELVALVGAEG